MKALKKMFIIFLAIFGVLLLIIAVSLINHSISLSKENHIFLPIGDVIEVNGHNMHIYTEGKGNDTLVFMAGGGTSSPMLDFKSLYSLLSNKYKIAVVEKAGYGFSEKSNISRDIDTILQETRKVLSKAGLEPPYILFPHSMSGIEALYWIQEYPKEVKAIVGLDMALPNAYKDYHINKAMLNLGAFGSRIGITRFFPSIANDSAAIKYGNLTAEEKDIYRAVFYRRTLTESMFKEVNMIKDNATKVDKNIKADLPLLMFISNGQGTGWEKNQWIDFQKSYIENINSDKNKIVELDASHYIHNIEYEKIAEISESFINNIVNMD